MNALGIIVKLFPQYSRQYETSRSSSRDRAGPEYGHSSSDYEGYAGNRDGAVPGGVSFPGTGGHKEISLAPVPAGEVLLTWCAGLWVRAQACHKDRKKKTLPAWGYGFEAGSRAAASFIFLQAPKC